MTGGHVGPWSILINLLQEDLEKDTQVYLTMDRTKSGLSVKSRLTSGDQMKLKSFGLKLSSYDQTLKPIQRIGSL